MNQAWRLAITVAIFGVLGAGCEVPAEIKQAVTLPTSTSTFVTEAPRWKAVGSGVERLEFTHSTTTPTQLVIYRFPQAGFTWTFKHDPQAKRVGEWAASLPKATLVVNGVYFHEDNFPSGFMAVQGGRIGKRQFDSDLSGLIKLAPNGVQIINTKNETVDFSKITDGAQSYPFLILDGQVVVSEDSGKFGRRTFIGLDRQGRVYAGVAPNEPITLRELSMALAGLDVNWDRVLNLDGGASTGLKFNSEINNELFDSYTVVPNVLVASPK